jgi:hypothetical protein
MNDRTFMPSHIPYLPILKFLWSFALFLLPGYAWVSWLHRRDQLVWPGRWALGFVWSFALFGIIGTPFLWFGGSFAGFLSVLYPTWALFALASTIAWVRPVTPFPLVGEGRGGGSREALEAASPHPNPRPQEAREARGWSPRPQLFLVVYLGAAMAAGWLWVTDPLERKGILYGAPLILMIGYFAARFFRSRCNSLLEFTAHDESVPPKLWSVAAAVVILLQATSAVIYSRPDWDDCYYLAAVLDYEQAQVLNNQEPTHREGFPVKALQRPLCWELWGAVLSHESGVNPMALYHTLLPGLLVLLAYGAYTGLLAEFVPKRWVPIALLGLSAVNLWGISSHDTPMNLFLTRAWQAKSVLTHLLIPMLVISLVRYLARPSWRWWLSIVACVVCSLAMSLSAIFMEFILLAALTPVLLWTLNARQNTPARRTESIPFHVPSLARKDAKSLAGVALAASPLVLVGLYFSATAEVQKVGQVIPGHSRSWQAALAYYTEHGCAEVIWILSLPILAILLAARWRRAYLVIFPLVLGLTFANPLFYDIVAQHLTSYVTYARVWWLLPVAPGLGALLALSVRALVKGARGRLEVGLALFVTAAALLLTAALPNLYVWSPRNNFLGSLGAPRLAENMEKMPAGLKSIAQLLADAPNIRQTRLLCNEQVASFLTPYSRDFRFVQTRPLYTPYRLYEAGRGQEGLERYAMSRVLQGEPIPWDLSKVNYTELKAIFGDQAFFQVFESYFEHQRHLTFRELCDRLHVEYVVTGPDDRPAPLLADSGFRVLQRSDAFILWHRARSLMDPG